MQFLETDETSLLHSILVNHVLIINETARADMLINCGLSLLLPHLSSLMPSRILCKGGEETSWQRCKTDPTCPSDLRGENGSPTCKKRPRKRP